LYLFYIFQKTLRIFYSSSALAWRNYSSMQRRASSYSVHSTFFCPLKHFTFFKLLFSTVVSSPHLFQAKKVNWNCTTMCRTTISVIGLALAGLSFAQTSTRRELFNTVTLYVPGADVQPLVASIVDSVGTTTKYPMPLADFFLGRNSDDLCHAMR